MTESYDPHYAMQAMRARSMEQAARALMDETDGLGEMQAYRVIQMQRAMRGMNKKIR